MVTLKLEVIGDNLVATMRAFEQRARMAGDRRERSGQALPRPWVAEITGADGRYRFGRQFLRGAKDYTEANSVGSRGVYLYFHLEPGRIYEVFELLSWHKSRRYFCRVEGDALVEMSEAEVDEAMERAWVQKHCSE